MNVLTKTHSIFSVASVRFSVYYAKFNYILSFFFKSAFSSVPLIVIISFFQDDSLSVYFLCPAESREPLKVVRIGNPDNIHEDVSSYSLTELIRSNTRAGNIVAFCSRIYRNRTVYFSMFASYLLVTFYFTSLFIIVLYYLMSVFF